MEPKFSEEQIKKMMEYAKEKEDALPSHLDDDSGTIWKLCLFLTELGKECLALREALVEQAKGTTTQD